MRTFPIIGGLGAAALLWAASTLAAPSLDEAGGKDTIMPPTAARVPFVAPTPLPAVDEALDPQTLANDPDLLGRFIEANPKRLDATDMEPEVALTVAQILLRGDRTFLAERLLWSAMRRWPERADIIRAHARVLISLGRPDAAIRELRGAIQLSPGDPAARYLLGRALLTLPASTTSEAQARTAFEAVLEIDPNYRDPEGVGAADIRRVLTRLREGRSGRR